MSDTTIQFKTSDGEVLRVCAFLPHMPQVKHRITIDSLPYIVYRVNHTYGKYDRVDITIMCDRI